VISENNKVLLASEGPLLITHWGMSGPAILKLSAWGARLLEPTKYHFTIEVNWLQDLSAEDVLAQLVALKHINPKQTLQKYAQFEVPKRLWQNLLKAAEIDDTQIWADVTKKQLHTLSIQLTASTFQVTGKSTFKEEFVTAGGVALQEVNFKTFESKLHPNLYFAGEVLNIDAITGGFNFQNAWTGGFIVAKAIAQKP
jgi:predicted Rossmann fold flavoprotein